MPDPCLSTYDILSNISVLYLSLDARPCLSTYDILSNISVLYLSLDARPCFHGRCHCSQSQTSVSLLPDWEGLCIFSKTGKKYIYDAGNACLLIFFLSLFFYPPMDLLLNWF